MKKCPNCKKGSLTRKTIKETYEYKGQSIDLDQPGEFCNSCEEGILNSNDMKQTEAAIHDWQAKIDGFLPSQEVRRIRKKLGLTQHKAAKIFGGGPNAFSRYENGEALQIKATDNLLRLLDRHPHLLAEISTDDIVAA
ncbi:MAG: type II toxin-antitoxin system MqsA family antitoxin [Bdellovibrionota bacterium]